MPDFTARDVENHCKYVYVVRPGQEPVVDFLPELKRAGTEVYPDQDYSSIAASIDDCAGKSWVKSDIDLKRQCSDCGKVFLNYRSYAVHVYQVHPKAKMTLNKWSTISQTQK